MRQLVIGSTVLRLRPVAIEQIIDLRHAVLRAGLPRKTAFFPGDDAPGTHHYGAFADEQLVCCLTLLRSAWQGEPAWQLRGMATAPAHQRSGIGRELVQYAEQMIREADPSVGLMWCNARVPAKGFYQKLGWQVASEVFEIPTAGPHVKMVRRLE